MLKASTAQALLLVVLSAQRQAFQTQYQINLEQCACQANIAGWEVLHQHNVIKDFSVKTTRCHRLVVNAAEAIIVQALERHSLIRICVPLAATVLLAQSHQHHAPSVPTVQAKEPLMLLLVLRVHPVFTVRPQDWLQCRAQRQTTVRLATIATLPLRQQRPYPAARAICAQPVQDTKLFAL